jgi:hypothetical protein
MNKLTKEKQRQVVAALVEGNSIRATCLGGRRSKLSKFPLGKFTMPIRR